MTYKSNEEKSNDKLEKLKKTTSDMKAKSHFDIKKIWLFSIIIIAFIAVTIFVILTPSLYKTELSAQNTGGYITPSKSEEKLIIEDLLGVESDLEEISNLAKDKVSFQGIFNKLGSEEDNCKGNVYEDSKRTFFDSKNNFNVIEHEIFVEAGIKNKELVDYIIGDDGILYQKSTYGEKKYKAMGGIGIGTGFDSKSSHYNKYIDYGILGIMCTVSIESDYSDGEKGYSKELDEEDNNFEHLVGTAIMWGVYADGSLTTNSDTYIVIIGRDYTLNDKENDSTKNALSDSDIDKNPYPNLKENISPISEIHIFNFNFSLNEETREFVNKWSYAVNKNSKTTNRKNS